MGLAQLRLNQLTAQGGTSLSRDAVFGPRDQAGSEFAAWRDAVLSV